MNDGNDRERVMTSLVCRFPDEEFSEMDQDAIYEICSKKSLYGSLDRSKLNRDEDEDAFEERNPNMPRLGSRVRRGWDWKWHDQDNFGLGTVIGHCKKGPDWEWENQDGGAGSIGSVVTVVNNCIVLVRWQHGFLGQYRFGCNGKIDLQICDPFSQDAVRHRDELMRSAALNCPPSIQASFNEDFEKPLDSIEEPDHKTSPNLATKPILHVIKGKYFRNDSLSSDIETDGPTFSCAKGHWFWKNAKGEWNPYCRETNAKINRCYERDRKSTAVVTVQNQK
uniref:E3 ubiquitin-protein ligase HERC2 n=1 Tax=Magallana gigas TaxID=29159 RepID=A0A8W8ICN8_MAGGI